MLVVGGNPAGVVQQAEARWKPQYADSPYREWFEQQRSKQGLSCCDPSDAYLVYDAYIKQGKWHVPIHGREVTILQVWKGGRTLNQKY